MMTRTLLALLLSTLILACGSDNKNSSDAAAGAAPPATLPSIELSKLEYLFENATYMDATFYDIPVSINQNELPQIQQTLATVSTESMEMVPNCKAVGHIWFQVNGKNVEEADIYFEADCIGYVWYKDGKPAYSNKMTVQGVNFYGNIFEQVKGPQ
jgi:hypothetical protein